MMNQDWEKLGDTIKNTVQSAIDAHDFDSLNQNIKDTIDHVKSDFFKETRGNSYSYCPGEEPVAGNGGYSYVPKGNSFAEHIQPGQPVSKTKRSLVYRPTFSMKAWGYIMLAVGGSMGLIFLLFFVLAVIGVLLEGKDIFLGVTAAILIAGIPGVIGGILAWKGALKLKKTRRFLSYVDIIGAREYCNIAELSERTGRKKTSVVKDIEFMIKRRWFRQGYLVGNKTCLVVTDAMYTQYGRFETERLQREREEKERIIQNRRQEKEQKEKKEEQYAKLAPDIRKVIEEGDAYIQRIHECNDAIPGEEISAKISRMETVIDRIFDRVEQDPESVGDIRRLMDYYLPITVKLLDAYKELDAQPVHGENIKSSKAEIEATLDTLNAAFEKLLDDLFQDTAWDVSSDISVLRTMLAQEGLTNEDWK